MKGDFVTLTEWKVFLHISKCCVNEFKLLMVLMSPVENVLPGYSVH